MIPKFHQGDLVAVNGEALYAEIIHPPRYDSGDYLIRLVYPMGSIRTRVYQTYAETHWRLQGKVKREGCL